MAITAVFVRIYFLSRRKYIRTKDDFVIICGDFGFWDESGEQKYWRKWLSHKPFTTLWVDGNHENYDLLKTYPVEQWKGGNVQFIAPDIIHLMRGQIFEIEGLRFFTFGGATTCPGGRRRCRIKMNSRKDFEVWIGAAGT